MTSWLSLGDLAHHFGTTEKQVLGFLERLGLVGEGRSASGIAINHGLARLAEDSTTFWHEDVIVLVEGMGLRVPDAALFDADFAAQPPTAPSAARLAERRGFDHIIATDGACSGNPGPGGWAWFDELTGEYGSGGAERTTNNIMELTAAIEAIKHAGPEGSLMLRVDSQYVINIATKWGPSWRRKGWKKADGKPVANQELVAELLRVHEARVGTTTWEWVRGHHGDAGNEKADQLAVRERDAHTRR